MEGLDNSKTNCHGKLGYRLKEKGGQGTYTTSQKRQNKRNKLCTGMIQDQFVNELEE